MKIGTLILVVWLVIGAVAAAQRGYFSSNDNPDCARVSTIAVTVVAGPLNYFGVNPKIRECSVPQPSE